MKTEHYCIINKYWEIVVSDPRLNTSDRIGQAWPFTYFNARNFLPVVYAITKTDPEDWFVIPYAELEEHIADNSFDF